MNYLNIIFIFIILLILIFYYFINNPPFPIDVVYTWGGEGVSLDRRTANNNELKYSLRSLFKFAPWINHVYIYMNPPKKMPSWFNDKYVEKITILDHKDTILKNYLPNSNSNAIETTLSNIFGLSEHFIYFNDDMFLTNPCRWTDFYSLSGKPYVDNRIKNISQLELTENWESSIYPKFPDNSFKNKGYLRAWLHIPLPRLKSQMSEFQNDYKEFIEWVRNTKVRTGSGCDPCKVLNLKCPCQQQHNLLGYYMYNNNKAVLKNYNKKNLCKFTFLRQLDSPSYREKLMNNLGKYLCVNDSFGKDNSTLENKYDVLHNVTLNFYEKLYPEKLFFEK